MSSSPPALEDQIKGLVEAVQASSKSLVEAMKASSADTELSLESFDTKLRTQSRQNQIDTKINFNYPVN